MSFTVIAGSAGAAALILMSLLRVHGPYRVLPALAAGLAVLLLSALLLSEVFEGRGLAPASDTARVAIGQARRANDALQDPELRHVIIIQGASYTARGVDGALLERLLRQSGIAVHVVQLSFGGTNHFEQFQMLKWFLYYLSDQGRARLRQLNVVRLQEVSPGYDLDPLAQFRKNRESTRTYAYMDIGNIVAAYRSIYAHWKLGPQFVEYGTLLAPFPFARLFNVGAANTYERARKKRPIPGFAAVAGTQAGFAFGGMTAPSPIENGNSGLDGIPQWLRTVQWPRFAGLFDGREIPVIHYFVPQVPGSAARYAIGFCREIPATCLDAWDLELRKALDHERYWWNLTHLRGPGAEIYTAWLAERLARQAEFRQ